MNFKMGQAVREAFGHCPGQARRGVSATSSSSTATFTTPRAPSSSPRSFRTASSTSASPSRTWSASRPGWPPSGKRAWASSFAAFVMCNAYDQLRMSVAFPCLDVKVVGTHAGICIGEDGPSQMGIEDVSLACSLPNFTVVVPADELVDAQGGAGAGRHQDAGLPAGRPAECADHLRREIRFPPRQGEPAPRRQGRDDHRQRSDGRRRRWTRPSNWRPAGIQARVLDMHTVKPLDDAAVLAAARDTGRIVVAEEHLLHGGLGSAVAMSAARQQPVPMRFVGIERHVRRIRPGGGAAGEIRPDGRGYRPGGERTGRKVTV